MKKGCVLTYKYEGYGFFLFDIWFWRQVMDRDYRIKRTIQDSMRKHDKHTEANFFLQKVTNIVNIYSIQYKDNDK